MARATHARMRRSLGLALALCCVTPSPLGGEPASSPAAAVEAYYAALAAGDAAAAEALLASDAIVLENGHAESRAEYLARHLAADIAFARALAQTRSDVRVVQAGDVAWVSARSHVEGDLRGRAIRSQGSELIVLSCEAQGWRIRAIHWSSHPLQEPPAKAAPGAPAAP